LTGSLILLRYFDAIEVGGLPAGLLSNSLTFPFWLQLDVSLRETPAHLLSLHNRSSTTIDVEISRDFLSLHIGRSQVYTFDHAIPAGEWTLAAIPL
jgi:hypothetical protein